jgi:Protein of unknown function (DUF1479)
MTVSGYANLVIVRLFLHPISMAVRLSAGKIPVSARALKLSSAGAGANTIRSTRPHAYMRVRTFTKLRAPPFPLPLYLGSVTHTDFRNQCSIFRPWQGWTSMSATGPGEGTLRVAPLLKLATAYLILRPFFKPRQPSSGLDDWVVDLENANFPGSQMGKTQELNNRTHPHLQLSRTMVSVPRVEPGDQIYCGFYSWSHSHQLMMAL